jgi:hypothetical protein
LSQRRELHCLSTSAISQFPKLPYALKTFGRQIRCVLSPRRFPSGNQCGRIRSASELEALLAVEIVAAGFSGLRLLRQSQQQMTQDYIDTYGNYAIKLLRLQNEMIQTFDRYRRGNKQTVEVRHVHIHPGGQGVVGIINPPGDREGGGQE